MTKTSPYLESAILNILLITILIYHSLSLSHCLSVCLSEYK